VATTLVQDVCCGPAVIFAQHAASVAHGSAPVMPGTAPGVVVAVGTGVVGIGVASGDGHCVAQLCTRHAPTAIPACPHPGAARFEAHFAMLPPLQTHVVNAGQALPTAWSWPEQLVAKQLLHASVALGSTFPKHAITSAFEKDVAVGAGCPVARGGVLVEVEVGDVGDVGGCAGSDPHAIAQAAVRTTKTNAPLFVGLIPRTLSPDVPRRKRREQSGRRSYDFMIVKLCGAGLDVVTVTEPPLSML
jgi:hypothetical protein